MTFDRRIVARPLVWIALLTTLAYYNSLSNGFVGDDALVITNNRMIRSAANLPRLLDKSYLTRDTDLPDEGTRDIGSGESSYRPLVTLTYFADYAIWKETAFGYHLTNVTVHLVNAALVYVLAAAAGMGAASLGIALLFSLHPVNTEAVNAIAYREDLLALFFMLLTVLSARRGRSLLSGLCFFAALLSKETAVVTPFIVIAFNRSFSKEQKIPLGPFAAAAALYGLLWFRVCGSLEQTVIRPAGVSIVPYAASVIKAFGISAEWFAAPWRVHISCPDPGFYVRSAGDPHFWTGLAAAAALVFLCRKVRRSHPLAAFGLVWAFLAYLPASGLVPIRHLYAARYLYIPSAGIALALGALFFSGKSGKAALPILLALLAVYGLTTAARNEKFRGALPFLMEMTAYAPGNAVAHTALGEALVYAGRPDEAIAECKRALALATPNADVYHVLAMAFSRKHDSARALEFYQKAEEAAPGKAFYAIQKGNLLGDLARYGEADAEFARALEKEPRSVLAYVNRGVNEARQGRLREARRYWLKALEIDPASPEAWDNLKKLKSVSG